MSERWRGLHNPERHRVGGVKGEAWCNVCAGHLGALCLPDHPCICCLEAEVEKLRFALKVHEFALREVTDHAQSLTALVQRVRELLIEWHEDNAQSLYLWGQPVVLSLTQAEKMLTSALDGSS